MPILGDPGTEKPPVLKTSLEMALNTTLNMVKGRPGPVDVNGFKCLLAAMYLGIVGPCVFIIQPAFVQGLVAVLGFDDSRAGYVAAAEMWGIALATLALTLMPRLFGHWRHTLLGAVFAAAAGNFASALSGDVLVFSILRFLVGLGSGVCISLSFIVIGLSAHPERNFGYLITGLLGYAALGFLLVPPGWALVGMEGILVFFGLFNLSLLLCIKHLPGAPGAAAEPVPAAAGRSGRSLGGAKALAVAAMFAYFLAQGVVWAYLFLIGVQAGIVEAEVSAGLSVAQFFGIAGALTAAVAAGRFGQLLPLVLGMTASVVSLSMLLGMPFGAGRYLLAVSVYNYAWNMTHPFLLAALAGFDGAGRILARGVAAQMLGLALGPALAAYVLSDGVLSDGVVSGVLSGVLSGDGYAEVIWLGLLFFVAALFLIVPALLKQRRAQIPALVPSP